MWHWVIEFTLTYSDHLWTTSAALAGGYAATATKHGVIAVRARIRRKRT